MLKETRQRRLLRLSGDQHQHRDQAREIGARKSTNVCFAQRPLVANPLRRLGSAHMRGKRGAERVPCGIIGQDK